MVTFRFSQYNFGVANDGCSVMTSGWSNLPEGYYYVDARISKNGYNTYTQAGSKYASAQYYMTVHLTNQSAEDSTYSKDTMVCSFKGKAIMSLTLLMLTALLLGC